MTKQAPGNKRSWHLPNIITVGGIMELTEGTSENVRDNHHEKPPTYHDTSRPGSCEVDLDDL
jgi:hypothetical protein